MFRSRIQRCCTNGGFLKDVHHVIKSVIAKISRVPRILRRLGVVVVGWCRDRSFAQLESAAFWFSGESRVGVVLDCLSQKRSVTGFRDFETVACAAFQVWSESEVSNSNSQ